MQISRRNRLIQWLLTMLAALGVIVVVVSGGPAPVPAATTSQAPATESQAAPSASATESPLASSEPSTVASTCTPTDQDQYVYHPARLVVLEPCIRITGTIYSIKTEADGDLHIRLTPDPAFADLINARNVSGQLGKLVIEPVCEQTVTQSDAQATCAADSDPLDIASMQTGMHVSMEGRYVTDSQHGGWAELHPLYHWAVTP